MKDVNEIHFALNQDRRYKYEPYLWDLTNSYKIDFSTSAVTILRAVNFLDYSAK